MSLGAGGQAITSAPSIGSDAIWAGSNDGNLYAVRLDGGGLVNATTTICPKAANPAHLFTPVVYQSGVGEVAYAGAATTGSIIGLQPSGTSNPCASGSVSASAVSAGLAMNSLSPNVVFASTTTGTDGFLELFKPGIGASLSAVPPAQLITGRNTAAPPAIDSDGTAVVASGDGTLYRASPTWTSAKIGSVVLSRQPTSLVIAANHDLVTGTRAGLLYRLTSAGVLATGWPVTLDATADVSGVLLAAPASVASGAVIYVTTSNGALFALDEDGKSVWTTLDTTPPALGTGTLGFPTVNQVSSGDSLPTLYSGSSDGHVYAVVVDSGLDGAPWPKAHHDARNTGNAYTSIP